MQEAQQLGSVGRRVATEVGAGLGWPGLAGPALFYTVLTLVLTWPLALAPASTVVGWAGDNFYFVWLVGWFQRALFELHQSPLVVPVLNYPAGWSLAYNEMTPAMVLLALPASLLGGPTLGYNVALGCSFVLSGLGVYLWVRRLSGSVPAALLAGTLFAFAPYRMSHVYGHYNLMGTQWFPFFFMALDAQLWAATHSWRRAVWLGLLFGLIGLTSQYYLYMTLLLAVCYLVGVGLLGGPGRPPPGQLLMRLVVPALVAAPLVALAVLPYLGLASQGGLVARSFEDVRGWSASPTDFFLPSPEHVLWGDWVRTHFDRSLWIESTLYPGALAWLLALLALLLWRRLPARPQVPALALTALAAFVLALGTDLHWLGQSVTVDLPAWVQQFHPYPQTFIPLPGYFLHAYLPFYSGMRGWMRYGIFVSLLLSVLAGCGCAWLLGRLRPRRALVLAGALLALVLFDLYPGPLPTVAVLPRPVDRWLAEQPGAGAVLEWPIGQATQPQQTYYTLIHGRPSVGGFFAAYTPPEFAQLQQALAGFPDAAGVARLRAIGVQYVLADQALLPDASAFHAAARASGLRLITVQDQMAVYGLP